jgi:hypothetical protein
VLVHPFPVDLGVMLPLIRGLFRGDHQPIDLVALLA